MLDITTNRPILHPEPASVPYSEYQRERARRVEAEAKLSAVAALIQNPALTSNQARTRAAVALALEAQRPAEDPRSAFRVDTGQLAKRAGLIPPTPENDRDAWLKAWKSGRKLAGQAIKELAEAGAFEEYDHPKERDKRGQVLSSEIVVRIERPHVDLIRTANRIEGTRKLQAARHHNGSRPTCPDCGPDAPVIERRTVRCICGRCGQPLTDPAITDRELPTFQRLETGPTEQQENTAPPPSDEPTTGFLSLETLSSSCFQSLETGETEPAPPCVLSPAPAVIDSLPLEELRQRPQWVAADADKEPINPQTGKRGSTTDPATWSAYQEAADGAEVLRLRGVGPGFPGFVLTKDDPFTVIDLDHCRQPDTGAIDTWALRIVQELDAPTEISRSGTGLHIYLQGTKPGDRCKATIDGHTIELYSHSRYIITTGHLLAGMPHEIPERQAELEALYRRLFPILPPPPSPGPTRPALGDDQALIDKALGAKNGDMFGRLWRGDLGDVDGDESRGDWHLCLLLSYWTDGDATRIDRLFRRSGLYREKWDRSDGTYGTYGQRTIQRVLSHGRA